MGRRGLDIGWESHLYGLNKITIICFHNFGFSYLKWPLTFWYWVNLNWKWIWIGLQGLTSLPIETQTVKRPPRTAVSGPEIFGPVREHFDRVANFESGPESKSRSGSFGPPEVIWYRTRPLCLFDQKQTRDHSCDESCDQYRNMGHMIKYKYLVLIWSAYSWPIIIISINNLFLVTIDLCNPYAKKCSNQGSAHTVMDSDIDSDVDVRWTVPETYKTVDNHMVYWMEPSKLILSKKYRFKIAIVIHMEVGNVGPFITSVFKCPSFWLVGSDIASGKR